MSILLTVIKHKLLE